MDGEKRPESATQSSFFYDSAFRNTLHAANMAIWSHYADLLFKGDFARLVYSSTDFAFRARSKRQQNNNLNLPFMNFRLQPGGISNAVDRRWWNHTAQALGVYIPQLRRKLRIQPVTLSYDSTLYIEEEDDLHWTMSELLWDDGNETLLRPEIQIIDSDNVAHDIENIGVLGYGLNFDSTFQEADWLKQNRIRAIRVDMNLQTFLIRDDFRFGIPTQFLLTFSARMGLGPAEELLEDPQRLYQATIDQFNEETGPLVDVI